MANVAGPSKHKDGLNRDNDQGGQPPAKKHKGNRNGDEEGRPSQNTRGDDGDNGEVGQRPKENEQEAPSDLPDYESSNNRTPVEEPDWRAGLHDFGLNEAMNQVEVEVGMYQKDPQNILIFDPLDKQPLEGEHPDPEVQAQRVEAWGPRLASFIASETHLDQEHWRGERPLGYGAFGMVGLWSREQQIAKEGEEAEEGEEEAEEGEQDEEGGKGKRREKGKEKHVEETAEVSSMIARHERLLQLNACADDLLVS